MLTKCTLNPVLWSTIPYDTWRVIVSYLLYSSVPAVLTFDAYKNITSYCANCHETLCLPNGRHYIEKDDHFWKTKCRGCYNSVWHMCTYFKNVEWQQGNFNLGWLPTHNVHIKQGNGLILSTSVTSYKQYCFIEYRKYPKAVVCDMYDYQHNVEPPSEDVIYHMHHFYKQPKVIATFVIQRSVWDKCDSYIDTNDTNHFQFADNYDLYPADGKIERVSASTNLRTT